MFILSALTIIVASVLTVLLVRRNLRQRSLARRFRALFVQNAEELIGQSAFPEHHARQLTEFSVVPEGWLTRYSVLMLVRKIVTGASPQRDPNQPRVEQIPEHLRAKYVTAILALALADSYRCALLGRVWRGANGWVNDAVREVRPDVGAHATQRVMDVVGHVHAPRQWAEAAREVDCLA